MCTQVRTKANNILKSDHNDNLLKFSTDVYHKNDKNGSRERDSFPVNDILVRNC